jgi:hypothetical protein
MGSIGGGSGMTDLSPADRLAAATRSLSPAANDLALALSHREHLKNMAEAGEWIQPHMHIQCELWIREAERQVMRAVLCPGPADTIN